MTLKWIRWIPIFSLGVIMGRAEMSAPACSLDRDGGVYFRVFIDSVKFSKDTQYLFFIYPMLQPAGGSESVTSNLLLGGAETWLIPGPSATMLWKAPTGRLLQIDNAGGHSGNLKLQRHKNGDLSVIDTNGLEFIYRSANLIEIKKEQVVLAKIESGSGRIVKIRSPEGRLYAAIRWGGSCQMESLFLNGKNYYFSYDAGRLKCVSVASDTMKLLAAFDYFDSGLLSTALFYESGKLVEHHFAWDKRRERLYSPMEKTRFYSMMLVSIDGRKMESFCNSKGYVYRELLPDGKTQETVNNPLKQSLSKKIIN